jgi:hypothetical protein
MPYRYDLDAPDEFEPCLQSCPCCGYPEPDDRGPILVSPLGGDGVYRSGYHLLACWQCGLTSYAEVPS